MWPWIVHNALHSAGKGGKFVNDNLLSTGAVVPFIYLASHRGSFPTCSQCDASIPEMKTAADGATGTIVCPGCAASHDTWPAAYKDSDGDETRFQVFMAPPIGDVAAPPPAPPFKPILFCCPNCGATLPIRADSMRVLTCSHCEADSYLPAEVWHRLHTVRRRRVFWVRTPT